MLTFATGCSGIGAPEVAWEVLGWTPLWCAEIDRAASLVLAHRFPGVPNHGDFLQLAGKIRSREIPAPDVFAAGTPCQAFSVAGLRGGLSDDRGQLTLAYIEIINAIDEVRAADGLLPCILVWENVPGVLNHEDNPLGCFLAGLVGDDDTLEPGPRPPSGKSSPHWSWSPKLRRHVAKWSNVGVAAGPQRAVAWRVFDAQYFGLAQRRRRVFAVGSAHPRFDPAAILFEFDGLRRDSAPSREAGEVVAALTANGVGTSGADDTQACSGHLRLTAGLALGDRSGGLNTTPPPLHNRLSAETGSRGRSTWPQPVTHTAARTDGSTSRARPSSWSTAVAKTLLSGGHANNPLDENLIVFHLTQDTISNAEGLCHALGTGSTHGQACVGVTYSVALRGRDGGATAELGDDLAGCLRASGGGGDKPHVLTPVSVCVTGSVTHTLTGEGHDASEDGTGRGQPIINSEMAVRRLMEVECERLQGLPDDWTLVPTGQGKFAAGGPRYKQVGNSMAVPCMRWIGRRIEAWHQAGEKSRTFEDLLG